MRQVGEGKEDDDGFERDQRTNDGAKGQEEEQAAVTVTTITSDVVRLAGIE